MSTEWRILLLVEECRQIDADSSEGDGQISIEHVLGGAWGQEGGIVVSHEVIDRKRYHYGHDAVYAVPCCVFCFEAPQ